MPDGTRVFEVVTATLNVRTEPTMEARTVIASARLKLGDRVEVEGDSRREKEGYIWWKHATGWSAEKSKNGRLVYMVSVQDLIQPQFPTLFQSFPIDIANTHWFYYYGNTIYAFKNGWKTDHNYDGYSQGLHGGIDFGDRAGGNTVFAGVDGIFDGPGTSFGPKRLDVIVGEYRIIYGHLKRETTPGGLAKGQPVTPQTPLGTVSGSSEHLHIEIRHVQKPLIYNPLWFFAQPLIDQLVNKFNPDNDFQPYTRWQTFHDQPIIIRGGPVIGPRA